MNLRKAARGQPCDVMLPGVCCSDPETTVLAHVKAGWFGMGTKPPDILGVHACHSCHDEIDRRTRRLEREFVELEALRAMYRRILRLCESGVIKW